LLRVDGILVGVPLDQGRDLRLAQAPLDLVKMIVAMTAATSSGMNPRSGAHASPAADTIVRPAITRYHSGMSGSDSSNPREGPYIDWNGAEPQPPK